MEKPDASKIAVLLIGIVLLLTTFFDVYLFLKEDVSILPVLSSTGRVHWVGGGKISEESLAAGFKHSALLVLIAIVASKVVPLIM
jgi:hypothetical protein